jgi:putative membrane protein
MIGLIVRIIINALALLAVAYFVPGVHVSGWLGAIISAIILGVVNAILRPILLLLTLPFVIITLGLFTLVINAITFELVAHLGLGLTVDSFGAALIGALVLSIVSFLLSTLVKAAEEPAK